MVTPALVWSGLDPDDVAGSRRLRRRLTRAPRRPLAAAGSLALAAAALGIAPPPRGPLVRLSDGGARDERAWFLAEPVNLVADRDRLRLVRLGDDGLDPAESAALVAAAREYFSGTGFVLERSVSGQWVFACSDIEEAAMLAPEAAAETETLEAMPQGADGRRLARILTELQMLWHTQTVNRARRAAGRREANALWVWDGGRLPAAPVLPVRPLLFADAPEIVGLARWLDLDRAALVAPATDADRCRCLVVVGSGEELPGEEWLARLVAQGLAFELFVDETALAVPARRTFLRRRR